MPLRLLALDTATRRGTVAISAGERLLSERSGVVTTHSETLLSLIDEALRAAGLTAGELDAFVCGRGPGSFTGLRIGLATAKGLCFAAGKPLLCVSSLYPLAAAAAAATAADEAPAQRVACEQAGVEGGRRADGAAGKIPVESESEGEGMAGTLVGAVLDARRGEVFCALYRGVTALGPDLLLRPEQLIEILRARQEAIVLVGDGALLYHEQLLGGLDERARLAPEGCHEIEARYLAEAALPRALAGDFDDLAAAVPHYIRPSDARLPAAPPGAGEPPPAAER